ncbi:hypothetical protein [Paludisphaera mucosa]|uniref:Uncharacterized protein n=1 Tax=Paludisphaera mucosa TaxID=3030827 RepID=A0ABT6F487_9BACT|nr:hypothetical protein [Paludisphaera mucosa]MDG3002215.1 hypothetical protein [Paludisphaera mucosa]
MESFILLAATTPADDRAVPPWITTAAYFWLAMLCAWAWRESLRGRPRRRLGSLLWLGLAILFATLGCARPFGLQAVLTNLVRRRAVEHEWYGVRRKYQFEFIMAVAATTSLAAVVLGWVAARGRSLRDLSALAPVVLLLGFIAIRASSFHYVDAVLYRTVAGVSLNTLAELTILGLVALSLAQRASANRSRREPIAPTPGRDDGTGARRYSVNGPGPSRG